MTSRWSPQQIGVAQLLVGSTIISFSAVFVKLSHIGPTPAGFYRQLFGAAALIIVVAIKRESLWRGWMPVLWGALAGLFFTADLFFWHRSIIYIGPGLSTIMGNFQVFFMALVGVFIFKEKATWRFIVSIPLAFTGLFLLVGLEWSQLGGVYKTGVWFGLLTAITYAGYLLTLRRSQREKKRLGATANLFVISVITALLLLIVCRVEGNDLRIPDAQTWVTLIAYGVLCQAIGWIIISKGMQKIEASRVGLLLLLQPTLTFIWDIIFFQRPTSTVEALGATLAVGAIYLGNTRRK